MMKMHDANSHVLRPDYKITGVSHPDTPHSVVFAVKPKNTEILDKVLHEVSDPASPKYGQHWTRQQVADLTVNEEGVKAISEYLTKLRVPFKISKYGQYITATTRVSLLEQMFEATFFTYEQIEGHYRPTARAHEYSVDAEIYEHVQTVLNLVDLPFPITTPRAYKLDKNIENKDIENFASSIYAGNTYPQLLYKHYRIKNEHNSKLGSQCIYAAIKQSFSQNDLEQFQGVFGLPFHPVDTVKNGYMNDSQCFHHPDSCTEANLDVQYILAVAPHTPTLYWYDTDNGEFSNWLQVVSDDPDTPLSISISYGIEEQFINQGIMNTFNDLAKQLAVVGVTIVAASGDDGAPGYSARNGNNCKYMPIFPASSPYVVAVGGTMGPETSTEEITCSSATGSEITTGGGFSQLASSSLASYQTSAVASFVSKKQSEYNKITYVPGRGYPDVSIVANKYLIQVGTNAFGVSGTSASAPVFAGYVSLVNAGRLAAGKSALGWLNPALYQLNSTVYRDITKGDNYNTALASVRCPQGFSAVEGWDPVTGLGAVDYVEFCRAMDGGLSCSAAAGLRVNMMFVGVVSSVLLLVSTIW